MNEANKNIHGSVLNYQTFELFSLVIILMLHLNPQNILLYIVKSSTSKQSKT